MQAASVLHHPSPKTSPGSLSRTEIVSYFLIAAVLTVLSGLRSAPGFVHGDLVNPDSYMRLARLRDSIAQGMPLHHVMQDGSGEGTLLHWSHLIDSMLLLLSLPLRLFLTLPDAVHGAALAFGPISMGLIGVACAWAAAPLTSPSWRWSAPVLAAMTPPIIAYGLPGVAHHHVPLAIVAVVLAGAAGRLAAGQGLSASIALASAATIGLWLSPEAMPLVLLAFGGAGLAWLRDGSARIGMSMAIAGALLAVLTAAAYAVDPPSAAMAGDETLRLSVVYVAFAVAVGVAGVALWQLDRANLRPLARATSGVFAGLAALGCWIAAFPRILLGTNGVENASELADILAKINEMQPVATSLSVLTMLLDGGLAIVLLAVLAVTRRSMLWGYAALCVTAAFVLGALHVRFATYAAAAAVVCLPIALGLVTERLAAYNPLTVSMARVGVLAVAMLSTRADTAFALVVAAQAAPASAAPGSVCRLRGVEALLAPYSGHTVLIDVSNSPELIYRAPVKTVGSLYLNVAGFARLRDALRSGPSDAVPASIRTTHADLVLFCRNEGGQSIRSPLVSDLPADTLWDRLNEGGPPAWLVPIGMVRNSDYVLYRIEGLI